tara:strand:- start:16514 stop:16636 length:123 start_codon:yes stop_codon:yes gene_type:complete
MADSGGPEGADQSVSRRSVDWAQGLSRLLSRVSTAAAGMI